MKLYLVLILSMYLGPQVAIPDEFAPIIENFKNADSANPWGTPHADMPEEIRQYGDLAGLWVMETQNMTRQGEWVDGEPAYWAFKYILNGQAVQDLFLQEVPGTRSKQITQLRQLNLETRQWHVSWINTVGNRNGEFTSYPENGEMVMLDADLLEESDTRVIFRDITANSFVWESRMFIEAQDRWLTVGLFKGTRIKD